MPKFESNFHMLTKLHNTNDLRFSYLDYCLQVPALGSLAVMVAQGILLTEAVLLSTESVPTYLPPT